MESTQNMNEQDRVEELKGEAHENVERAGNAVHKMKDNFSHTTEAARQRAEEAYHRAQEAYGRVADTSIHDVQHSLEDYTRTKPMKALLIAAGVGLVAGIFLRNHK